MKMTIGGKKAESKDKRTLDVFCPVDNQLLDAVPIATKEDVDEAVRMAWHGQKIWSKQPLHYRVDVLHKYIELLDEHKEEVATLMSLEQGRPYWQNIANIDNNVKNIIPGYLDVCKHQYGRTTLPGAYAGKEKDFQVVVREPLGVVATIIPFNSPINLFLKKAIPALAVGNSLVVKPASDAPLAMIKIVDLFVEAGVTPEAVNIVTGSGAAVGKWISENPKVAAISFTGSTEVGAEIVKNSSRNLTRCFMELGGNDACIITDDADINLAAKAAKAGRTANAGQICASPKRYIVHKNIAEEFTLKLVDELKTLKIGAPMDPGVEMCCLINEKAAINAENQIKHTVDQGAVLVYGGKRRGAYIEPAVLSGVTKNMDIAKDMEVFAPVFPIIAVEDDSEAIDIANSSSYGLSGAVFCRDFKRAFNIANAVETGQMVINWHSYYLNPDAPFGGYKKSGLGREGIMVTLDEFTQQKTITLKDILF